MQQPSETSVLERPVGVLQLVDALAESKLHWDGDGFTSWASETFGISTSSVKRAMRVATSVCPDVLDALRTDRAASNDRLNLPR